jgi:hypothetical protein
MKSVLADIMISPFFDDYLPMVIRYLNRSHPPGTGAGCISGKIGATPTGR